jgi:hypothetical protein
VRLFKPFIFGFTPCRISYPLCRLLASMNQEASVKYKVPWPWNSSTPAVCWWATSAFGELFGKSQWKRLAQEPIKGREGRRRFVRPRTVIRSAKRARGLVSFTVIIFKLSHRSSLERTRGAWWVKIHKSTKTSRPEILSLALDLNWTRALRNLYPALETDLT